MLCSNPEAECAYYAESGKVCVLNNSLEEQETVVPVNGGTRVTLRPMQCLWIDKK